MFLYQIWRCLNTHEPADFHSDPWILEPIANFTAL
jgi:hypothetical protein